MRKILYVIFRYLTYADFFNIYKPAGAEVRGGGQTYIDFGIGSVAIENWENFFQGARNIIFTNDGVGNLKWEFPIRSIGTNQRQTIKIYQRRPQSLSIAAQRIGSDSSNRVFAWHPDNGFPEPADPSNRRSRPEGLAIYLARCNDGTIWAGWFQRISPCRDANASELLSRMISQQNREGYSGFIDLTNNNIILNSIDREKPFISEAIRRPVDSSTRRQIQVAKKGEVVTTNEMLDHDLEDTPLTTPQQRRMLINVLKRNKKAVRDLKLLYHGECQISGQQFTFRKVDGTFYSEAHHLIPLGRRGADSPFNIIIVSPLIHRMLHYANVEGLDLSRISEGNVLEIRINGQPYAISWHPSHAYLVRRHQS